MSRFDPEKVEWAGKGFTPPGPMIAIDAVDYAGELVDVVPATAYTELYEAAEAMARFLELAFDENPPQVLLDYRGETEHGTD